MDNSDVKISDNVENFQNFIYKLFEKNGVLQDLRAYLRGHIVTVLKSVESGEPSDTEKHFTQRLELTLQAINVVIAEYLLKMDFTYSFSVFISEIPLANMVFDFTKHLFNSSINDNMHFTENDIWRILNYLGIKCDSEHALKILEVYQKGDDSLLVSILKHTPLYKEPAEIEEVITSEDSLSSGKTHTEEKNTQKSHRCKHYAYCKSCRSRLFNIKEKYKRKKNHMVQKEMKLDSNTINADILTRKVRVVEEKLIEEMFEQLKNVYEGEVEMMREEERKKVKRSLASHALVLQRQREELEEEMRVRQCQMEKELQEKKEFVRGLAASLRAAHQRLVGDRLRLRGEAGSLLQRENNLKTQLQEAEETLKLKGEEMRKQISDELNVLDRHLQSMKRERDAIDREREELENIKRLSDNNIKLLKTLNVEEKENLMKQYESMKNELAILRKYLERTNDTKNCELKISEEKMNNEQDNKPDDRVKQSQVINDLKKMKNVNFSNTNIEMYHTSSCDATSSCETRSGGSCDHVLRHLREENARLKEFAKQQRSHMELLSLSLRQTYLPERPSIASTFSDSAFIQRTKSSFNISEIVARNELGGGEEPKNPAVRTNVIVCNAKPCYVQDPQPSQSHCRWNETRRVSHADRPSTEFGLSIRDGSHASMPLEKRNRTTDDFPDRTRVTHERNSLLDKNIPKTRDCTSKLWRSEIKENLKKKYKEYVSAGEKSPTRMLREAKLRLRRLEIEAEAIETSYMNFRQRRANEKKILSNDETLLATPNIQKDTKHNAIPTKHHFKTKPFTSYTKIDDQIKMDFDKYLCEYQNLDVGKLCTNRNTTIERVKPIPHSYYEVDVELNEDKFRSFNYLDTPLLEFRKLYQLGKYRPIDVNNIVIKSSPCEIEAHNSQQDELKQCKTEIKELKILQNNINKMYNLNVHETLDSETNHDKKFQNNVTNIELNKTVEEFNNDIYVETTEAPHDTNPDDVKESKNIAHDSPKNVNPLKIEAEDKDMVSTLSKAPEDLMIVVQTTVGDTNRSENVTDTETNRQSPQITIIVSPRENKENGAKKNSIVTENAFLNNNEENDSQDVDEKPVIIDGTNFEINEISNQEQKDTDVEYPDDFSADVDNYNSPSEYGNNSPMSILKSEDDNFWDS